MSVILVTGGAGFIGSHMVEAPLAEGHEVVTLDNFDDFYPREIKERNLAEIQGHDQALTVVEGDIRDRDLVHQVFAHHRPERVVHLAARAGVRPSILRPDEYLSTNVGGTLNLLLAAVEHGVERFVFGSSSSVYGKHNTLPYSEEQDVTRPISPYAASKLAAEVYCHTYHHLHDLPIVVLRFFTVYGPRQRPDLAINKFVRLMLAGEPIPVFGDGSTSRDYTFVKDIVAGVQAALACEEPYSVINLGNSSPVTLNGLIAALEDVLGRPAQIETLPDQAGDVPHTYANIERARELLGWQPRMLLHEGLQRFVDWHLEYEE